MNFSRSALFHTNTKVCLIYFGQYFSTRIYVCKVFHSLQSILRLRIIVNIRKISTLGGDMTNLFSENNTLAIVVKKLRKSRYQRLLDLPNFAWFFCFAPNILIEIAVSAELRLCQDNGFVLFRSIHPEVFCIKLLLKVFPKFTGKHLLL